MTNETTAVLELRNFIRDKTARRNAQNLRMWRRAADDAKRIIALIIDEFDPVAIYQWGSILDADAFTDISDIDIAVEGLDSAETFFALVAMAEKMTDFPLDIVEMEKVEPEYARLIRTYGRCAYRRDGQDMEGA
ncbi:nucleotidyltransferase domain-containing protein [Desulfonatronum thioautotrophicum]|uniref:nucleotidyltransferase domain-containing protein n=1 Tax=Desulfonatronum thioautotrophicum TaxID=617001 RepID=UPI0005EB2CE9|nr:nucleotidyltransferase domain-containing protein [Desulfonatronum thioautotrophicum]